MKYVDEYRRQPEAQRLSEAIARLTTRSWTLMEICGGQTHSILKYGLDQLLPQSLRLVHGPGCPVCVTAVELIDRAVAIARRPEAILASFGDMLRVPGSSVDLLTAKAEGADVRMVYSPLDAVAMAERNPDRQVAFFAVGFETTAPANAMAVWEASRRGLGNFSLLSSHVLVPPAMEALLSSEDNVVQAFLAAGHVCSVMGYWEYEPLAARHRLPVVVTGFEPLDILQGVHMAVAALEAGRHGVENQYRRAVNREGNRPAQALMERIFERCDRTWRGIGEIPGSGLRLRDAYAPWDAERRFDLTSVVARESAECIAGKVLRGLERPTACPAFGTRCTPEHPLGAPMVSSEGACAAYHRYGRADPTEERKP